MKIKKICTIIIALSLTLTIAGCNSPEKQYQEANEKFDNEQYAEAMEIYEQLGDYEDSTEKKEQCEKEIGMRENADYEFLTALEESVLDRHERAKDNDDKVDRTNIVNTELAKLEQFSAKTFFDEELKGIADKYIHGLNTQKKALENEYYSYYQVEWQEGYVERAEALNELYTKYGFLKDNNDFVGTYIYDLDKQKEMLEAYNALEADILSQMENVEAKSDNYSSFYFDLKNNTKYTFSTVFIVDLYDKEGTEIDSRTTEAVKIAPDEKYRITIDVTDPKNADSWAWENYYSEIFIK